MSNLPHALIGLCLLALTSPAWADEASGIPMIDLATTHFQVGEITSKEKKKVPCGTAETTEGKFGKAVKLSFIEGASGGFMMARLHPTPDWDKADGFSFWVKGDGSDSFGGIELIDKSDFSQRYGYCFPINSTEWKKITVRWTDLTPELASPLVGGKAGYSPSNFGNFWFGKWFYWRDYPAHSYAIDRIALEPKIAVKAAPADISPGLGRFAARLKAHQPVTIVTMGDSLTDTHHWANRTTVWTGLLAKDLKAKYASDVTLINPAIGGTTLSQNMVLMPRWEKQAPSPDLVTLWFGGNDWNSNVRAPQFASYLREAVDRIRRDTHGSADILIVTTWPTHGSWETLKELEQAAKDVAAEKKTGLADVASELRKAGKPDDLLKEGYWVWDKVHMGPKGHELMKETVMGVIEGEGK